MTGFDKALFVILPKINDIMTTAYFVSNVDFKSRKENTTAFNNNFPHLFFHISVFKKKNLKQILH